MEFSSAAASEFIQWVIPASEHNETNPPYHRTKVLIGWMATMLREKLFLVAPS